MAFDTPDPTCIVLSAMGGNWETWESEAIPTDSGWDTARILVAKDYKASVTNGFTVARAWPRSGKISGENFWIDSVRPRRLNGNIWTCELSCKGLLSSRPIKVRGGAGVEQQNSERVSLPGITGLWRAQVMEASPNVNIEYITIGAPPTGQVGRAGSPAFAPAVRASVWGYLTNPLVHFPHGWVMLNIDWDQIPGTMVHLVRETWQYVHLASV